MPDKEWHKKYPEKHAEKQRRWVAKDPEHARASRKRWEAANPERVKEMRNRSARKRRAEGRREMIAAYGGACSCCGETREFFLTIEHIGGLNGRPRQNTHAEIRRLRAEGWPDTCTCLCFNCNLGSYRNGGTCPHVEEVEE